MMRQILLITLLLITARYIQGQSLPRRLYTPKDGLPQSQVENIYKDKLGNLWLGTHHGISRFDGLRFETFPDTSSNYSDKVLLIQENRKYGIVALLRPSTLFLYKEGKYRYLPLDRKYFNTSDVVNVFASGSDNEIYFLSQAGNLLHKVNTTTGSFTKIEKPIINNLRLDISRLFFFWLDGLQQAYAKDTSDGSLYYYSQQKGFHALGRDKGLHFRPGDARHDIFYRSHTSLPVFDGNTFFDARDFNLSGVVDFLSPDTSKDQYFIDYKKVYKIPKESIYSRHIKPQTIAEGFNNLAYMIKDQNTIWLGDQEGLVKLYKGAFEVLNERLDLPGLAWSALEDNKGTLWVATYGHGLWYKEKGSDKFVQQRIQGFNGKELTQFYHGAIRTRSGRMVFPAEGQCWAMESGRFFRLKELDSITPLIVYEDAGQHIWIGSTYGVHHYDKDLKLIEKLDKNTLQAGTNIVAITSDKAGSYWFGSRTGLAHWENGKLAQSWTVETDKRHSTVCLFTDHKGNVWAGGRGHLTFIKNGRMQHLPLPASSQKVQFIESDGKYLFAGVDGFIWAIDLSAWYAKDSLVSHIIGEPYGFIATETGQNGISRNPDGTFWVIAGSREIYHFDPSKLLIHQPKPQVYITGFGYGKSDSTANTERIFSKNYTQNVEIPTGERTIVLTFSTIDHQFAENTKYAYHVFKDSEELAEYSGTTEERKVVLNLSKPGDYRVKVAAVINGVEYEQGNATLEFTVIPVYWETDGFKYLAGAGAAALLICLTWLIVAAIRRKKRKQQRYIGELELELKGHSFAQLRGRLHSHIAASSFQSIVTFITLQSQKEAVALLTQLGKFLRKVFIQSANLIHPVYEEAELIQSYFRLQEIRYKGRFTFSVEADDKCSETLIPTMMVLTYAENIIKHAMPDKPQACHGSVRFNRDQQGNMVIVVEDNGKGFTDLIKPEGHSLSVLAEIYRLSGMLNDKEITERFEPNTDAGGNIAGTKVIITIPKNYQFKF